MATSESTSIALTSAIVDRAKPFRCTLAHEHRTQRRRQVDADLDDLELGDALRARWDTGFAERLADQFALPDGRRWASSRAAELRAGARLRTILLSTHRIDEVASILEDIVIINHGRLLMQRSVEDLQAAGVELTGPAEAVDAMTAGLRTLSERQLGRTKSVVVFEPFDGDRVRRAIEAGIDVGPIPLQDLFVHLTSDDHTKDDATSQGSSW